VSLPEGLAGLPAFRGMDPAARRALLREAIEVPLRTGRALCCQGDRAERCWVLVSGRVRGVMYRSDETTVELGRSVPGDWLGLAELLLDSPYLADQVAEEHCTLAAFGRVGLGRLLEIAGMRAVLLREMAKRYYTLHARIELAGPLDRLVRFLLDRSPGTADSGPAAVAGTQEEIAEAIGATRETVNRHLQRLQDEGLVKVGRGAVTVVDPARLASRGS
jgi:CRP/FNR family transcriptional regulator, cyclic AMP receptor protein